MKRTTILRGALLNSLSLLNQIDHYRHLFTDVDFWTPTVQRVCARHSLSPCSEIHIGVPGTYPTFIVEQQWVVKFFGRLFNGGQSYTAEREAGRLVKQIPDIRTARLLGWGELDGEDWPWPYLIFEYLPGISIGEASDQLSLADRLEAAALLGETIRLLHSISLAGSPVFPNSYKTYRQFLTKQRAECVERQREWGRLPAHLLDQIEAFLPRSAELIDDSRAPHLIHADLTRDHLLGRIQNGRWTSLGIIDFGDAMTGDLLYELAALHLDLFGSDKRLLAAFLKTYELPDAARADLPRKALATALLHQFNVFVAVPEEILRIETLQAMAEALWQV